MALSCGVIVGLWELEQFTDNIAAGDLALTEQDRAGLDEAGRSPMGHPIWIREWFAPTRIPAGNLA